MEMFKQYEWTGEKPQQINYLCSNHLFRKLLLFVLVLGMFCTSLFLFTILLITFRNTGRNEATWRRERKKTKEDTVPSLEEIPRLIRKETLSRLFYRVQGVEDREARPWAAHIQTRGYSSYWETARIWLFAFSRGKETSFPPPLSMQQLRKSLILQHPCVDARYNV